MHSRRYWLVHDPVAPRCCMFTRLAVVVLMLLAAGSAQAEVLSPEAARRFVAGKLFAFNRKRCAAAKRECRMNGLPS